MNGTRSAQIPRQEIVGAWGHDEQVLLSAVVNASTAVAATRSRNAKIVTLAEVLRTADVSELGATIMFLIGQTTQGKIGAGWRTLADLTITPANEPSLTISEVDTAFGEIGLLSGAGSSALRSETLLRLFAKATQDEQNFLFRLLTGELRQGALEGLMLDAISTAFNTPAEAVRRAFMLSGTLSATALAAKTGGESALKEFRLQLGRPIRPMLASPAESLSEAVTKIPKSIVEYKMDGARIQVHRNGDEVHVYTRTLREITEYVPELVDLVRALPCQSVVLDGETLALTDDGKPRPFQETQSRFGSTREEQTKTLLLRPYFFDCLYLDGKDFLDEPLSKRNKILKTVAGAHLIPGQIGTENADGVLERALAAGHEGVMVKSLDSPYLAGRRGHAWLKVKPVHTLDLIVLAAEWGYGRRTGYLSNLHLGARDPDGGPPIMVGKTFKGLTDALLAWQTDKFQQLESRRTESTVFVQPELVVEIELDGALKSTRYPGGLALRFARVVRYREDKDPADADTIDAVRATLRG
jgi:DNA ligase-1